MYILRCTDGSYYIGHTDDLDTRVAQHESGFVSSYTRVRRPIKLMFSEEFPTRDEAKERERQLKGWSRAKKEALIAGNWDRLRALARHM